MASLVQRGENYYVQWRVGSKIKRRSLRTDSLQLAKEKLRQFESAQVQGYDLPLPTRTKVTEILTRYVEHIRTTKTAKSAQTDIYYLRQVFGPICPALQINSRKASVRAMKRPPKPGQDRRYKMSTIDVSYVEDITTAEIANFIGAQVRSRGLAPKTANRYREILHTFFSWAIREQGVKMPCNENPVSKVSKYKEHAPKIRFLTLAQVDEQLHALEPYAQLQVMVAVLIYAGLRREELLWLTLNDVDLEAGSFGLIRVQAKTVCGEYWQPKTKINRAVPISSALRYYLEKYVPRLTADRWFFPSPQGKGYDPDNFSRDLRNTNRKAGLQWTCLDFRHTFGSQLAMKGESLYKISALMGNSPEICRKHYAALIPEAMVDSVEFIGNMEVSHKLKVAPSII
jgi:integrase